MIKDTNGAGEIAVDAENGYVYWINTYNFEITIERANILYPSVRSVVYQFESQFDGFSALEYSNAYLYFTVKSEKNLYRLSTENFAKLELMLDNISDFSSGMISVFYDPDRLEKLEQIQKNSVNPCQISEKLDNPCSHICVTQGPDQFQCHCPVNSGLVLDAIGQGCQIPENFVLVASPNDGVIYISTIEQANFEPLVSSPGNTINAIEYDTNNQILYWSDNTMSKIYRKRLFVNLENKTPSSENLHGPTEIFLEDRISAIEGLAIDLEQNLMYFTNVHLQMNSDQPDDYFFYGTIEMVSLLDPQQRKIIYANSRLPRDILINKINQKLYFTDRDSKHPTVVECDLDGMNCGEIISGSNLIRSPNGISIFENEILILDSGYSSLTNDKISNSID